MISAQIPPAPARASAELRLSRGKLHTLRFRGCTLIAATKPYEIDRIKIEVEEFVLLVTPDELQCLQRAEEMKSPGG